MQYALETNDKFRALHSQYQRLADPLGRLLEVDLQYTRKAPKKVVQQALRRIATTTPHIHQQAEKGWRDLLQVRKDMQTEKSRSNVYFGVKKKKEVAQAVAAGRAVPITRKMVQQAQQEIASCCPTCYMANCTSERGVLRVCRGQLNSGWEICEGCGYVALQQPTGAQAPHGGREGIPATAASPSGSPSLVNCTLFS